MSVVLENVRYSYPDSAREILDGAQLDVAPGEHIAVVAPSGEGKTTLLAIAGLLLTPDSGTVWISGTRVDRHNSLELRNRVAWLPQTVSLLPRRSVVDNVVLAGLARGRPRDSALHAEATTRLAEVGIVEGLQRQARTLSGGEAQRVGIARALLTNPRVIIADEPTANLDGNTAQTVARALLGSTIGRTVIIATHDPAVASQADRVVRLKDGQLTEEGAQ